VENIYVANIFRTIITKFYQNRPGFVDNVTKTFGVFWGSHSQFQLLFTYKTRTLIFTRLCSDIIQVSRKKFKLMHPKFIQDIVGPIPNFIRFDWVSRKI